MGWRNSIQDFREWKSRPDQGVGGQGIGAAGSLLGSVDSQEREESQGQVPIIATMLWESETKKDRKADCALTSDPG